MKRLLPQLSSYLLALAILTPLSAQETGTKATPSALIIFDASGSMWGQIKGKAKIEIAREVVGNLVKDLPAETELGLMTYGHRRKGDCDDIELLIPVGKVDRSAYIRAVEGIMPKGMTPITASLELAAEGLGYKEQKATVILVSDGLETCDADPCSAAKKLEELGVDFTAHVIAFDLKPEESEKLRCIADSTGGKFFPASDAGSLKDALDLAVDAAAPTAKAEAPAPERQAELSAPDTAIAGSDIEISWKVDTEKGDYITIAKAQAKDNENEGYAYTFEKASAKLTAPLTPGDAEIRYISGSTGKIIARRPISLTEFQITLKAPAEAIAGSEVMIEWIGPGYESDFITIVPKSTENGKYERWAYTRNGNPLTVPATFTIGDAEIRYMNEKGNTVLSRHPLKIIAGEITLMSPAEVTAGASVQIEWAGPNNKGDFITIVPKNLEDGKYESWAYTEAGSPLEVTASYSPGNAEIRYMNEDGNRVLARAPLKIEAAEITLKSAPQALAGDSVSIEWTGPDNKGDFITIVPKNAEDGKYEAWAYTTAGVTLSVTAPASAG